MITKVEQSITSTEHNQPMGQLLHSTCFHTRQETLIRKIFVKIVRIAANRAITIKHDRRTT